MTQLPEGTVTILFTDVVGSTELTTSRGDEAAQEIMRAQRDLTRQQVEEHSGHEIKGLGDGFMVAFTTARQAAACAVGIQRALDEHNRHQSLDEQVEVRIGLNTGEVIHEEEDLFGEAVNAAARIAAKAKGGQILVSDMVKGLLGRAKDVDLVDRGRFRLKGFPERWRLFEVVWQEERPIRPALVERTPFVGREAERAELRRLLDQVAKGQGALVMIGGEPGVGKTRLAEELMAEARQLGMTAFIGHCYEMEGAPPYIPFVEILEAAAHTFPPDALRETLGDSAPEVAKLMPELRRLFPEIPASPELPPEQERRYLFNGMRDFLARAGKLQPMILLLDDLHWADDSTMLLIQHIAQQINEMPVLMVGTYRDVELDVARPLARTMEELTRQRLARRLPVKRLPEDGVSAMLKALSGQEPPKPLVDTIYSETEGNPFFLEEVFKHLAEEGRLFDAKGRWRSDLEVSELDVPEGVRLVIGRRLERTSQACRDVLTSAAVIGRSFTFDLLEAMSAADTDAILDAVDEAERGHLIASTSDSAEERFTFAHELIRQTLLSGLSSPRRRRLHFQVAEAIERTYAEAPAGHAAGLAHHLDQAGSFADPRRTAHYLALAGEQAFATAAFEDALRHFETALSLQPADDSNVRSDLLYKRGLARRSLGRWDEALTDWREALAGYEESGNSEAVGRISREVSVQLNWSARFGESLEIARRGLLALGDLMTPDRSHLMAMAAVPLSFAGESAVSSSMMGQALALAGELGDQRLRGQVLYLKAWHHFAFLDLTDQLEAALEATRLLRSAGGQWELTDALWLAQSAMVWQGRLDEVVEMGQELEQLAVRLGHLGATMIAGRGRAQRELMLTGDLERFAESALTDLELCLRADTPFVSQSYTLLGLADFWRGRWNEAQQNFQGAVDREPPGSLAGIDWATHFLLKAYSGEKSGALAMLKERRDHLPVHGQTNAIGVWIMSLAVAEGLVILDEPEGAAELYSLIIEALDIGAVVAWPSVKLVQAVAGIAAAAGDQWDAAQQHFEAALRQAHELPNRIEQPEVRRWYARMLIDRDGQGDRDKAFRLLTEAVALYREIGMPKHVEMVEALLGEV